MIQPDEFWDRKAAGASGLAIDGYHDPNQAITRSGRSVASVLPTMAGGGFGAIVPHATMSGEPPGHVAGALATSMIVDPDIPGASFVVNPSAITKQAIADATTSAGVRQATSIEEQRQRASTALRAFRVVDTPAEPPVVAAPALVSPSPLKLPASYTTHTDNGEHKVLPSQSYPQQAGIQQPVSEIPGFEKSAVFPPAGQVVTAAGPSLFSQAASPQAASPQIAPVREPVPRNAGVAPTHKVTLEVANSPAVIEAWYHQIIVSEHSLALCYDLATVGFPRATLRATEEDVAIHIEGSNTFYIVQDPNVKFPHQGEEIQLFFIKAEHPFNPTDESPQRAVNAIGPVLP